ncbi:MAG: DUF58 domain-containing protein [Solirubrobacteraceae bacterium]
MPSSPDTAARRDPTTRAAGIADRAATAGDTTTDGAPRTGSTRRGLVTPTARQGPGRVDGAALRGIEVPSARRGAGALPGDHQAAGAGPGTELHQLRPYVEGDDVRHIDAAASARTGEPHVRLHVPERTLTTWIALDVSASMAFGSADRLKSDVAEGAVRVLARLGTRHGGRVALLRFGAVGETADPRIPLVPPAGGRGALGAIDRALADGFAPDGRGRALPHHGPGRSPHDGDELADTIRRLPQIARRPGVIALVTDFRGDEDLSWERPLAMLARLHHVIVVQIDDPLESALPDAGVLAVIDPETGETLEVDTSSPKLRDAFAAAAEERQSRIHTAVRRARAQHIRLVTDSDWLRDLGRALR